MITQEKLEKHLDNLVKKSASTVQANQKYLVPLIATNDSSEQTSNHIQIYIENVETYHYDGKWLTYRYSVDYPSEIFSILKVDNIFTTYQLNSIPFNHFIGTINRLVFQGMIKPFILLLDNKIVSWDRLEFVYDKGDTYLLIRGNKYNHFEMQKVQSYKIILLPYRCEFIGDESDETFNIYYSAMSDYLQETSYFKSNGKFYTASPTLNTEYFYKQNMFNIGGWCMNQIKRYKLGLLSEERIKKLRNFQILLNNYDEYGNVVDSYSTKYNLLDRDVPTNEEIYEYLYGMTEEDYTGFPCLQFTDDGFVTENGNYRLYVTDQTIGCAVASFNENVTWDLSEISGLLFRENFLVFKDGIFDENFKILTAINNVVYFSNPNNIDITVMLLYSKQGEHVIRLSDKFVQSYMTEQAKLYFEALEKAAEDSHSSPNRSDDTSLTAKIDEDTSYTDLITETIETLDQMPSEQPEKVVLLDSSASSSIRTSMLDAHTTDGRILRGLTTFSLDTEIAFVPTLTDYIVFISRYTSEQEEALALIEKLIDPLDITYDKSLSKEDNTASALQQVIDYDINLLNPLYHVGVEQHRFTGKQANQSLIYTFMYESRRGIKIPRKRYRDHESYYMIFVNGELFSEYYKTICYANFFFIPIAEDFTFADTDVIEVLYFKHVNNNEIRFYLSDWLLDYFKDGKYDASFYQGNVFEPFIKPKELKIFAHYPRDMIKYPTLITEETENIAFNISYRDDENNLYIKKDGLTHIVDEDLKQMILDTGAIIPDSISDALDDITIDTYKSVLKDNTFIKEMGVNIFDEDHRVTRNALVAVSGRKFIYQRLFVECESYRIKLDKRFRYCDNPRQYLLFINGRRMRQDSFLITIPKHTLPFTGLYLYTAKFVKPTDRVELFYLPYDMTDINFDEDKRFFVNNNGYFEFDKSVLDIPLSKDFYMFFINGKKIPAADIIDIDSNTIRININTATLHYPMITAINLDSIEAVSQYLKQDDQESRYDALIQYIKNRSNGYELLDKMVGASAVLTDTENDKIWMNVAKIAILNEVIRDFWVTSGYDYHKAPFIYDYDLNEYFEKDKDGNLILPSMDARPFINIQKNDISLLYFYTDPEHLLLEYGATVSSLKFFWEYSQRLNQPWQVLWQRMNNEEIPVEARTWEVTDFSDGDQFLFEANTGQQIIRRLETVHRANGTYWGMIPAEFLEHYRRQNLLQYTDELLAVIPLNKQIPPSTEQEIESGNPAYRTQIEDKNTLVYNLTYAQESELPIDLWMDPWLQNMEDAEFLAIFDDGTRVYNPEPSNGPRPDRMDDLLYTFPCAILQDKRFICEMELYDLHREEIDLPFKIRDFNILDSGFTAEIDGKDPINDMIIVKDKPFLPPDDTIYDMEEFGLIAITLDDHRVLRDMHYDGISKLYPKVKDHTGNDYLLDETTAVVHPDRLRDHYRSEDYPEGYFMNDFLSIIGHKTWNDIIVDYNLPKRPWPLPDSLMVFDGICGAFENGQFVEDIGYETLAEKKDPIDEIERDFLIDDNGFLALVSEVKEKPSIRSYLEPIMQLRSMLASHRLEDIEDDYIKIFRNLSAQYEFPIKLPVDDRLIVTIAPFDLFDEVFIPEEEKSDVYERDFLIEDNGFLAIVGDIVAGNDIIINDNDQDITYQKTGSLSAVDLDTGITYEDLWATSLDSSFLVPNVLDTFNSLSADYDFSVKLPQPDMIVAPSYIGTDYETFELEHKDTSKEYERDFLIDHSGFMALADIILLGQYSVTDESSESYIEIDDLKLDGETDIGLLGSIITSLDVSYDLPYNQLPSEMLITPDYIGTDYDVFILDETDDPEGVYERDFLISHSDFLAIAGEETSEDEIEVVDLDSGESYGTDYFIKDTETSLTYKELWAIIDNENGVGLVRALDVDYDLPYMKMEQPDLLITLEAIGTDYEPLYLRQDKEDGIYERDFLLADDGFLAIAGDFTELSDISVVDLDTDETLEDVFATDSNNGLSYANLWAISPNENGITVINGLGTDYDLPYTQMEQSDLLITPEYMEIDYESFKLEYKDDPDGEYERDFLIEDNGFLAIVGDIVAGNDIIINDNDQDITYQKTGSLSAVDLDTGITYEDLWATSLDSSFLVPNVLDTFNSLSADYDLPHMQLIQPDMLIPLDSIEMTYELLSLPDEDGKERDFLLTKDIMAIAGELTDVSDFIVTDLDSDESYTEFLANDEETEVTYNDLWAVILNENDIGIINDLQVYNIPYSQLPSEMVVTPDYIGTDYEPLFITSNTTKKNDFLLADDGFMAILDNEETIVGLETRQVNAKIQGRTDIEALSSTIAVVSVDKVITELDYTTESDASLEFIGPDGKVYLRLRDDDFYAVDIDDGTIIGDIEYDIDELEDSSIISKDTTYKETDLLIDSIGVLIDDNYHEGLESEDLSDYPAVPLIDPSGNVLAGTVIEHDASIEPLIIQDIDSNETFTLDEMTITDVDDDTSIEGFTWIDLSGEDLEFMDKISYTPIKQGLDSDEVHVINMKGTREVIAIVDITAKSINELSSVDQNDGTVVSTIDDENPITAIDLDTGDYLGDILYSEMATRILEQWDDLLTLIMNEDADNNLYDPTDTGFEAHLTDGTIVNELTVIPYAEVYELDNEEIVYLINKGISAFYDDTEVTDLDLYSDKMTDRVYNTESLLAITSDTTFEGLEIQPVTWTETIETEITSYLMNGIKAILDSEVTLENLTLKPVDDVYAERNWLLQPSRMLAVTELGILEGLEIQPATYRETIETEVTSYLVSGVKALLEDETVLENLRLRPIDNEYTERSWLLDPTHKSLLAITEELGTLEELEIQPATYRETIETEVTSYLVSSIKAQLADESLLTDLILKPIDDEHVERSWLLDPTHKSLLAITELGTLEGLEIQLATYRETIETETISYLYTSLGAFIDINGDRQYIDNLILKSVDDLTIEREWLLDPTHKSLLAITEELGILEGLEIRLATWRESRPTLTTPYIIEKGIVAFYDDTMISDLTLRPIDDEYAERYWLLDPTHQNLLAITEDIGTISELDLIPYTERYTIETEVNSYLMNGIKALIDGNTLENLEIRPISEPPEPEVEWLFDPTHKDLLAIVENLGTLSEFQIIPEVETHRIETLTYPERYKDLKAYLDDGTVLSDLFEYEECQITPVDPTHSSYFAILHETGNRVTDLNILWEPITYTEKYNDDIAYDLNYNIMAIVDENGNVLSDISFFDESSSVDIDNTKVFSSIDFITENDDVGLNVFDAEQDMIAIMHDGSSREGDLFYILEEKPQPEKIRNFFNLIDRDYIAYTDSGKEIHDISYIIDQDPTGENTRRAIFDIDAEWLKVIYPEDNHRIKKEDLWVFPNEKTEQRILPFYKIDVPGFSLITQDENGNDMVRPFPDLTWSANKYTQKRDIGFYDFPGNKDQMMAILNGSAHVLHGIDYIVDGQMDNNDLVVFEWDDTIFAMTMDGRIIRDFTYEDHDYSWSNPRLANIADDSFIAILEDGRILRNLRFYYDANNPDIRHIYDESQLHILISFLDKYLIPEPPYIKLNRYEWGNKRFFIFACPKRVVYKEWHCLTKFIMPDLSSEDVLNKCFDSSAPIYTDGSRDEDTNLLNNLSTASMEYMGECKFTNTYGFSETYMVWRSNGYFMRLNANAGLDMTIKIGNATEAVSYHNTLRDDTYRMSYEDKETEYIPLEG